MKGAKKGLVTFAAATPGAGLAAALAGRPGSGAGLLASRRIVRLHGARIDALSDPGNWPEFRFEVPAEG